MSRITKMKYVAAETVFDFSLPTADQTICVIVQPLGNNTHMIRTPSNEEFIASMPRKFRNHVYVKRGSYVVTEPIPEGKKVRAEIVRVLQRNQIKYFSEQQVWPEAFANNSYLDNTHKLEEREASDRGFVHGGNVIFKSSSASNNELAATADSTECGDEASATVTSTKAGNEPPLNRSDEGSVQSVADPVQSNIEVNTDMSPPRNTTTTQECSNSEESDYSESDDESDLVPNFNRKAVSRFVFSDDSNSDDSDADDSDADDDDTDDSDTDEDAEGASDVESSNNSSGKDGEQVMATARTVQLKQLR